MISDCPPQQLQVVTLLKPVGQKGPNAQIIVKQPPGVTQPLPKTLQLLPISRQTPTAAAKMVQWSGSNRKQALYAKPNTHAALGNNISVTGVSSVNLPVVSSLAPEAKVKIIEQGSSPADTSDIDFDTPDFDDDSDIEIVPPDDSGKFDPNRTASSNSFTSKVSSFGLNSKIG